MMRARLLLIPLLWVACATMQVYEDYDASVDFSGLQTFGWLPRPQPTTGDIRLDSPLIDSRIRAAIERTLVEQGYTRATKGAPDFLVGYQISLDSKLDVRTTNDYYGYGGGIGRYGRVGVVGFDTTVQQYDEGTLVIDIANSANDRLLWRGWGSQRLRRNPSPEQTTERINRVVSQILGQFPPGARR
jgi:hypothetical protein